MGVHYDSIEDRHWPYPDSDALATDYDRHIGEKTVLFGSVQAVDRSSNTARMSVEHDEGRVQMTVRDFDVAVRTGGVVQVLGTLEQDQTIRADRVAVVNPSGLSELYKYAVSLVGAALVLVVFFRHWRVNTAEYSFEAR